MGEDQGTGQESTDAVRPSEVWRREGESGGLPGGGDR